MEDREKEGEIGERFSKALKETPEKFPKMLTNTCFTGRCKGFRLIEADNEEQLKNLRRSGGQQRTGSSRRT